MTRGRPEEGSVGVGDALSAVLGGVGFVVFTPSVWPLAAVPVVILLVLFCGVSAFGGWGAWELSGRFVGGDAGSWSQAGRYVLTALLGLLGLVVALLAALGLTQPLSGFALERIASRQEQALTGRPGPEVGFLASLIVGLKVGLTTVLVAAAMVGALFVVGLLFPPALAVTVPLKFFVTAWLLAWDLLDYPLALRGLGVRARLRWATRHFAAFTTFGLAWVAVLLVPGLVLLLLPMGVAGATRLVVAAERG